MTSLLFPHILLYCLGRSKRCFICCFFSYFDGADVSELLYASLNT